jgi:pimeloyl-ACP methyl ester carboxylesterase
MWMPISIGRVIARWLLRASLGACLHGRTSRPNDTRIICHRRAERLMTRQMARWQVRLIITLAAVAGVGAAYQLIAAEIDRRAFPPPGRLVDVDGHRLHVRASGSASDAPTVILEGGAGLGSVTWAWVQPRVAERTRVVAYDRAGVGWSDRGPEPRDGQQIATELHAALDGAGVSGPYVLVGHSFGGVYVRIFADLYPDEVVGLVLVDPTHPDQLDRSPREAQAMRTTRQLMRVFDGLSHLGLLRLANPAAMFMPGLPAPQDAELRAYAATGFAEAAEAEMAVVEERTFPQARGAHLLGARPLIVLSAGQTVAQDPLFYELHAELATLSTRGTHRVVDAASHAGMVFDATYAEATIAAINAVLDQLSDSSPEDGKHGHVQPAV